MWVVVDLPYPATPTAVAQESELRVPVQHFRTGWQLATCESQRWRGCPCSGVEAT
jgi:hypothetical protein